MFCNEIVCSNIAAMLLTMVKTKGFFWDGLNVHTFNFHHRADRRAKGWLQRDGWMGGFKEWVDGWAVCEVWVDRWVEGGKGGVKGPLLMKQKKGGVNLFRNLHRRRKNLFIYL
jgi:hypothetical protein